MIIYKQYTREQLNRQYNNRLNVPDYATYIERWKKNSSETGKKYLLIKDIAYGQTQRECLDIFPSGKPDSKTLVFIHGGYWQMFSKEFFHFIAAGFHDYGVTIVLINYPLAPGATLDEIVSSCRNAILWLHQNIEKYNGDPDQLFVAGHSAGGQLASMLLEKKWVLNNNVSFIKGICTLSGVFNLEPIELSDMNAVLNLSKEMALRNSALALTPANICPLLLFVGADETDEFKSQSAALYNIWKCNNTHTTLLQLPRIHHFSIAESLTNQSSPVHIAMCKLMQI